MPGRADSPSGRTRSAGGEPSRDELPARRRLADAEILRAAVFADALAEPDDVCVIAGDLNARAERSRTLSDLAGAEWGFSEPGIGIDHILVRGGPATAPKRWPPARRAVDEHRLYSDHAPVELWLT